MEELMSFSSKDLGKKPVSEHIAVQVSALYGFLELCMY
jgi:hypothetical protein